MGVPLKQQIRVGMYILGQKLRRVQRYPLVLMLEPLFRCNLACAGCGKIDYPDHILDKRIGVEEALDASDECGAPIVSIAGGEPLLHKELPQIVEGLIARKRYVYLCTNALLLTKRTKDYRPSPYLTFSIHLDGSKDRHDASVCQDGVFERCITAIKLAREKGFRITVNCTLFQNESAEEVAVFMDMCRDLDVEGVTLAPGFSYERAPDQQVFLQRTASKQLFRNLFRMARGRKWRFNHSSLYLDFLAGNQSYQCTAWEIRPAMSSVGKNPAICWWERVWCPLSSNSSRKHRGMTTGLAEILSAAIAWCIADSSPPRLTMQWPTHSKR